MMPDLLKAEDPVIIEEEVKGRGGESSLLKEIWEKNIDLDMGASRTFGSSKASRQLTFISLDFQREIFSWLKLRLGGKYYRQEVKFEVEVKRRDTGDGVPPSDLGDDGMLGEPDPNPPPASISNSEGFAQEASPFEPEPDSQEYRFIDSKLDKLVLRDAYLQVNVGESLVFTAGQQTIVWGQLDIFSPVDFLLPLDFSSPLSYSKVDMRLPILAAKLSWFPTSRLEIQGYYFPQITYDDTVKEELERDRGRAFRMINSQGEGIQEKVKFRPPKDESHYAARLLYYGDWATVGLTYFKGYTPFVKTFTKASLLEGVILQDFQDSFQEGDTVDVVNVEDEVRFGKAQGIGFEFVKTVGDWSWKADIMTVEDDANETLGSTVAFKDLDEEDDPIAEPSKAYWRWVLGKNKGNTYAKQRNIFTGIGFDAKLARWNINFYVYNFTILESDDLKELNALRKAAETHKSDSDSPSSFPAFNIAYSLDAEKNKNLGVAFGIFGVAFGISFYFLGSFWESLRLGVSMDVFKYALDDYLRQQEEGPDEELEASQDLDVGLRALIVYEF